MKRDYLEFMVSDMLMQFRGEKCANNRILLSAIARQLQDLIECFQQLEDRTYLKNIIENETGESLNEGAHNIHLDRIGEVVDLTRKQASFVSGKVKSIDDLEKSGDIKDKDLIDFIKRSNFSLYYPDDVLSDSEYSDYLYYKIFLNSSYCTYDDVLKSLKTFWTKTPIYYEEREDHPATIFLKTPVLKPEHNVRLFFLAPVVKSAGVGLFREAVTVDDMRTAPLYIGGGLFPCIIDSKLPYLYIDVPLDTNLNTPARLENITGYENPLDLYERMFYFFEYNGQYVVVRNAEYLNKQKEVVFPAFYRGSPIKVIGGAALSQTWRGENTAESVFLPSCVESISNEAFENCIALKHIKLPKSLITLGQNAFYECNNIEIVEFDFDCKIEVIQRGTFFNNKKLHTVFLPESIKEIKESAFYCCYDLKNVFFGGTKSQWDSIVFGKNNEMLKNANITFLGGE